MQILHSFAARSSDILRSFPISTGTGPDHCLQCETDRPLRAHGFYTRTLVDITFDGTIRVRRRLCGCCKGVVSLLSELSLPLSVMGHDLSPLHSHEFFRRVRHIPL
jgi:hypothetical protein